MIHTSKRGLTALNLMKNGLTAMAFIFNHRFSPQALQREESMILNYRKFRNYY
jgi:hypothetical protein